MLASYAAAGWHRTPEDQRACASHIQPAHPAIACHSSYQGADTIYRHVDQNVWELEKLIAFQTPKQDAYGMLCMLQKQPLLCVRVHEACS